MKKITNHLILFIVLVLIQFYAARIMALENGHRSSSRSIFSRRISKDDLSGDKKKINTHFSSNKNDVKKIRKSRSVKERPSSRSFHFKPNQKRKKIKKEKIKTIVFEDLKIEGGNILVIEDDPIDLSLELDKNIVDVKKSQSKHIDKEKESVERKKSQPSVEKIEVSKTSMEADNDKLKRKSVKKIEKLETESTTKIVKEKKNSVEKIEKKTEQKIEKIITKTEVDNKNKEFKQLSDEKKIKEFISNSNGAWKIKRHWNHEEVERYGKWIENIFKYKKKGTRKQKNATLDNILADSEMNLFLQPGYDDNQNPPLTQRNIKLFKTLTHCGSFPKLLFVYYSYKRGLSCIISHVSGTGGDIRYSKNNHSVAHVDNYSFKGNLRKFLLRGFVSGKYNNFTTGNFRTAPDLENTDSLPIKIDGGFLKPGSIAYNAGGHALLVGSVSKEGEVYFLDAHPDQSISYSKDLSAITSVSTIDRPESCYGGFRIMRLAVVKSDEFGRVTGVRPMTNEEMVKFGFSKEQYEFMKEIKKGTAKVNGKKVNNYRDYVRTQLRNSDLKENPFKFIKESASRIYDMFETRNKFVEHAWENVKNNGSIIFPDNSVNENIYQAEGRWETWSSPSSDADRKCAVIYVGERLESMINSYEEDSSSIDLSECEVTVKNSTDLAKEIIRTYREEFSKYIIEYKTSLGGIKKISLLEISNRLWDLSFDPNHPPEFRWGEPIDQIKKYVKVKTIFSSGGIMSPLESYKAQQNLRYIVVRQDTPTRLNCSTNPATPLKKRPDELLSKYVKFQETSMR